MQRVDNEEFEKPFNLNKLVKAMHFFESLLGRDWIRQKVNERDEKHEHEKYYFLCEEETEHPIIRNWPLISEKFANRKERKVYPIQQLGLIAPYHYMYDATQVKGFKDKISKTNLRDPVTFESFVFECKIASLFYRLGYDVEFLPERDKPTPDLVIKCAERDVYVECKKKMFTKKEKDYRIWACKIAKNILNALDYMRQNLFIEIFSEDYKNSDITEITESLKDRLLKESKVGEFSIDNIKIKWRTILPFNMEKTGFFNVSLAKEPSYLVNTIEIFVSENGKIKYRNPRVIVFYTNIEFERAKPLVQRFRDALKQVEEYLPSLVYLEIEKGTKTQALQDAEKLIEDMFNPSAESYDGRTEGVNYCIFTSVELTESEEMLIERTVSRVLENKYAKTNLPKSFFKFGKWFPGNAFPETIINEGLKLSERGKYSEAIAYYDFALKLSPYIPEGWNNKGNALNKLGKYSEALECFDKALQMNPHYASAWMNKGISLANLGNHESVLKCFDRAIEIKEDFAQAWYNKGLILFKLGRVNEGLFCAERAIKIKPEYENAKRLKELCQNLLKEKAFKRVYALKL